MNHTSYKLCIIFLLFHLHPNFSFAQTKEVDSLRRIAYNTTDEKKKLAQLFALCDLSNSLHPDSLNLYCTQAYTIAKKINNKQDLLLANLYKATYLNKKGKVDSAETLIDSSLALLQSEEERPLRFRFLILKSNVLIRADRQKESMANSLQLLHAAEQAKDYPTQIRAKNNIGWAYMELGQNRDALNWFFEAAKLEKKLDDKDKQPFLYSNMAAVYNNLAMNDSAEFYAKQAINIATKRNELSYMANAYFIYASITDELGKKQKTEQLLEEGIRIRKLIGDPFYIVSDIFQLGVFYGNNHETDKGIAILREGINTAIQNNLYEKLPILYTALSRNYKAAGNFAKYGEVLDTILLLKDSLYRKNSAEALAELQAKYELQKKETTILHQQYDLARKNELVIGSIGLLAAVLILGYFYFQNRKKNQRLKLQTLEMEQKKKTTQAVMQAEEQERKRIAGELHDSVAQKMVVAKISLEALTNHAQQMNEKEKKIFSNVQTLLEESTTEIRNLSHIMMPQILALAGLSETVKSFLDKVEQADLKINFSSEGDFTAIPENTALMIYRVIQEAVQNVLKHASATKLDVSMICENNEVDVIIEDNGVGFNTSANDIAAGNGLANLRSRIAFLNGKLDINSTAGSGTIIAFYIPLI